MWSNYKVKGYRAGYAALTHWGVIETIVQSAAIYSAALISLLSTYLAGSNAQYICLDSLQPLIVGPSSLLAACCSARITDADNDLAGRSFYVDHHSCRP